MPNSKKLMNFFVKKGCWFFFPRYRGTWESGGEFLEDSPEKDIRDVIDSLDGPIIDAYSKEVYRLPVNKKIIVIGSSFGGAAALLVSSLPTVSKVISVSGVVDWLAVEKDASNDELLEFIQNGFGKAYRFKEKNWNKLMNGKTYQPVSKKNLSMGIK